MPLAEVYVARHATPDWNRKDIPYDVPPGPPLTPQGEWEAKELGSFLANRRIRSMYASPLERAHRTAVLVSDIIGIQPVIEHDAAEWRNDETRDMVAARLLPCWQRLVEESSTIGPVCLVTHGGPLGLLLYELGMPRDELLGYQKRFDNNNGSPPAGLWHIRQEASGLAWKLDLVFMPGRR